MTPPLARMDEGVQLLPLFSAQQLRTIRWIATFSASISILFALVATYWFWRMKRKFRHLYGPESARLANASLTHPHSLIMKLIACGLFRCIWFFVYPVIALRHVGVTTVQRYCEVSGFFLALGTEAVGQ